MSKVADCIGHTARPQLAALHHRFSRYISVQLDVKLASHWNTMGHTFSRSSQPEGWRSIRCAVFATYMVDINYLYEYTRRYALYSIIQYNIMYKAPAPHLGALLKVGYVGENCNI